MKKLFILVLSFIVFYGYGSDSTIDSKLSNAIATGDLPTIYKEARLNRIQSNEFKKDPKKGAYVQAIDNKLKNAYLQSIELMKDSTRDELHSKDKASVVILIFILASQWSKLQRPDDLHNLTVSEDYKNLFVIDKEVVGYLENTCVKEGPIDCVTKDDPLY